MTAAHTSLHDFIISHYSLEEFQTLCFDLSVPYDDLPGKGLSGQARELILHLWRQERLTDLLDQLEQDRPSLFTQANLSKDLSLREESFSNARLPDELERGQSQSAAGQTQVGGIHAGRIEAENVVSGVQILGGDLADAADAVALAEALERGDITANSIQARNVVAGFQYIADPSQATPGELRQEVALLRQQLSAAVADGELTQTADMDDAQEALEKAEAELSQEEPQGKRIKYMDLLANAVMLQNVVDITDGLHQMAQEGYAVTKEKVARLSPYLTEHIKRFGEYVVDLDSRPVPLQPDKPFLTD